MSRSNPTENSSHPCARWLEWDGANGSLRYYDKEKAKNIDLGNDFVFILLDQLGCVKGWHDSSESGIYSNEVKSTRTDILTVKAFKHNGLLAQGIYGDIRDQVSRIGGHFTANLYVAYKGEDGALTIGSLQFKGAALREWSEFSKKHRADLYKKAIRIHGSKEGKKGKVTFQTPIFKIVPLGEESNEQAGKLDETILQPWLKSYLGRNEKVHPAPPTDEPRRQSDHEPEDDIPMASDFENETEEQDIPF